MFSLSPQQFSELSKIMNKKLKSLSQSCPLDIDFTIYLQGVQVTIASPKQISGLEDWDSLFEDFQGASLEEMAKHAVYNLKRNAIAPFLPMIEYRKYETQEKTSDEMVSDLLKNKGEGELSTYKTILQDKKLFVVEKVDLPSSTFTLLDHEGNRVILKHDSAAAFLLNLRSGNHTPQDLGGMFFRRAEKIKEIPA